MAGAQEVLLAVFHPLDGPSQLHREVGGEDGLGIGVDLTAEAATDIHGDDPQFVFRETEDVDHCATFQMRGLGGKPQRHVAGAAFVAGHHRPGLHRAGDEAGLDQARRDHAVGLTEGSVGSSSPPREFDAEIGAQVLVDQG
jgi:hypothetical protein